jgi:hypothetical protein
MLTCNGCEVAVPEHVTTLHDATCPHHAHREATGWGKCAHKGQCYRPTEGIAA